MLQQMAEWRVRMTDEKQNSSLGISHDRHELSSHLHKMATFFYLLWSTSAIIKICFELINHDYPSLVKQKSAWTERSIFVYSVPELSEHKAETKKSRSQKFRHTKQHKQHEPK